MANQNVLREREHVTKRIEYILVRVSDEDRNYWDVDRTTLMMRLEGYMIRLMKLPPPVDPATVTKQNEIYDRYESLVVADLDEVKKSVRWISGFLRRHRLRIRRLPATQSQQ